jgi:alpha-amylase
MRRPAILTLCACSLVSAPLASAAGARDAPQDWWHDAVFYEVFVRSFADSSAGPLADDGVGDLAGLIERLDVLNDGKPGGEDLGVNALWLMPIAQSPSYHGYDVVDYYTVDDEYGTNDDFVRLIDECEKRGIRVIVDLVLNHCSSENPWFERAASSRDNPYHDWFVWRDTKPDWERNLHMWHNEAQEATGQFYYGFFWHGMPDLNYDNPFVSATALDISRHWLEDLGAHGFRLDAIKYLHERGETIENTPETIAWLENWHRYIRSVDPDCWSVGEVWGPTEEVRQYVPGGMDSAFEFQLAETIVGSVNSGDPAPIAAHLAHLNESYPSGEAGAPYSTFLTNHDQERLMSQLGGPSEEAFAKNRLAASILLTLPGTPFLYYGEEIGMTGTKPDPQIRTPMQWTDDPERTGFTRGEPWAPVNGNTDVINLADQRADPASLWSHYRDMIALRNEHPALRRGTVEPVETTGGPLLAYTRTLGDTRLLVLANMGDTTVRDFAVTLDGFDAGQRLRGRVLHGPGRARPGRADDAGRTDTWQPVTRIEARGVAVVEIRD